MNIKLSESLSGVWGISLGSAEFTSGSTIFTAGLSDLTSGSAGGTSGFSRFYFWFIRILFLISTGPTSSSTVFTAGFLRSTHPHTDKSHLEQLVFASFTALSSTCWTSVSLPRSISTIGFFWMMGTVIVFWVYINLCYLNPLKIQTLKQFHQNHNWLLFQITNKNQSPITNTKITWMLFLPLHVLACCRYRFDMSGIVSAVILSPFSSITLSH
jgi:hypothetical protein